ncbi:hypothetical protein [Nonomuraea fuscirosea]|uniref:hypothetical protein n=1 Tax=Nonomuraea fuscirosea TaxID=1291556 RepID=UPI0034383520
MAIRRWPGASRWRTGSAANRGSTTASAPNPQESLLDVLVAAEDRGRPRLGDW